MPLHTNQLLTKAQEKVFIKAGKCLLNLQLFERRLKRFLPASKIILSKDGATQTADLDKSMLGPLINELKNRIKSHAEEPSLDSETDAGLPEDTPLLSMTLRPVLSEESYSRTIRDLTNLLKLRNELVHHFTEKFHLKSIEDCQSASVYLDELNSKTRNLIDALTDWEKHTAESIQHIQTPEILDYIIYGFHKDYAVNWEETPVVEELKKAESLYAKDGWTNLESAIRHMQREASDLTPKVYGCDSWRRLIKRSGLFEHRTSKVEGSMRGQFWYQSKVQLNG